MKIKWIAAFITTLFCINLHAAIEGAISGSGIDNSDLVLMIYDPIQELSYVQDLEVNYLDIIDQGFNGFPDPNGFFGNGLPLIAEPLSVFDNSNRGDLVWSMFATGQNFLSPPSQFGFVSTYPMPPGPLGFITINSVGGQFRTLIDAANEAGLNRFAEGGAIAGNETVTELVGNFLSGGGSVPFVISAPVDTSMDFYFVGLDDSFGETPPRLASSAAFTLDFENVIEGPKVVPLPAPALLLASGLFGLWMSTHCRRQSG